MCACVRARVVYYVTLPKLDENGSIDRSAARLNVVPAEQTASGLIRGCSTKRCYMHKCYDIRYRRRQQSIAAATGDRRPASPYRIASSNPTGYRWPPPGRVETSAFTSQQVHRISPPNQLESLSPPAPRPQITTQNNGGIKARSTPAI